MRYWITVSQNPKVLKFQDENTVYAMIEEREDKWYWIVFEYNDNGISEKLEHAMRIVTKSMEILKEFEWDYILPYPETWIFGEVINGISYDRVAVVERARSGGWTWKVLLSPIGGGNEPSKFLAMLAAEYYMRVTKELRHERRKFSQI